MIPLLKTTRERGFTSPYGPVLFSCGVFLFAWFFPPGVYTDRVAEPDRMFLDPLSLIYFFLCAAAFVWGLRAQRLVAPRAWQTKLPEMTAISPILYLILPLVGVMAFSLGALIHYGAKLNVVALLVSQQGQMIKELNKAGYFSKEGFWSTAPIMLIGTVWWYFYRLSQFKLGRSLRVFLFLLGCMCVVLGMLASVAEVDRDHLMSLVAGCALLYFFAKESKGRLRLGRFVINITLVGAIVVGLFLFVSLLRGNGAIKFLIGSLLGYSISPYNRMASLLHGQMTYQFSGSGIYLFHYLQFASYLDSVFQYQELLHWPTFFVLQQSEFASVALAGLNPTYNWSGVFGYLYSDLGWGAPIYTFFAGYFCGFVWTRFRRGSSWAIVCYPWVVVWIVSWHAANKLFDFNFAHLFMAGVLLTAWDRLLLFRPVQAEASVGLPPTALSEAEVLPGRT
jgi:hypothetical protein